MEANHLIDPGFWSSRESLAPGSTFNPSGWESGGEPGLIFFQTSGSTGEPRWIGISRESLLLSAAAINRHLEVDECSCWGLALPLNHVGGFGVVARAFEAGSELRVFRGKWDPVRFTAWLQSGGITHVSLVPTQVHDLVSEGLRPPSALLAVVVGGGVLADDVGRAARKLGWPVLASYGMTEAGSQIATQGLDLLDKTYQIGALPILPHWEMRTEENGRLAIKGPALYSGELVPGRPGHRFLRREGEWFVTQDLGRVESSGLMVIGRADRNIKILGELVDPEEVERELGIHGAVVIALLDPRRGYRLVAAVEEGTDIEKTKSRLHAYNGAVDGFRRVDEVRMVGVFPRSSLGKIKRVELAEKMLSLRSI